MFTTISSWDKTNNQYILNICKAASLGRNMLKSNKKRFIMIMELEKYIKER